MPLTILMYHYVRDQKTSRFPGLKVLDLDQFREQIKYLKRFYQFVSVDECLSALENNLELPKNSVLLTFDDGYIDHYVNVFPILYQERIPGIFFPLGQGTIDRKVLDVNKIQHVLAVVEDTGILLAEILALVDSMRASWNIASLTEPFERPSSSRRFDSDNVALIKRLLQKELPHPLRSEISDHLFRKYVTEDESSFAAELYLTLDQIQVMRNCGMYFGAHGWTHPWLDSITQAEQTTWLNDALEFMSLMGVSLNRWVLSYPYGNYAEAFLPTLREKGCKLAFTTRVDLANLTPQTSLLLPRLDTNDLPKDSTAASSEWTRKVL